MDYSMAVIWLIIAVACGLIEAGTIALVSVWFVIGAVVSFFMALIFPESILLQIFVFILLAFPFFLFSVIGFNHENIVDVIKYIIKYFKNRKLYLYK